MEIPIYVRASLIDNLLTAWQRIKLKDSAGGIDRVTVAMFEKNLDQNISQLSVELKAGKYIPLPYKEFSIPKDENEFRNISLPAVRDKIVQETVRNLINPLFEKDFSDASYGYRTGKGALKAIGRVRHLMESEHRYWLVSCDIDSYFDNIPHEKLLSVVSKKINEQDILRMLETWIKMGKVNNNLKWRDQLKGIPQGNIISPLLSNVYLHQLDLFIVQKGFGYVRYADDFVILCHKEEEAVIALSDVHDFINTKLGLRLNPGFKVVNIRQGFEFLGIRFGGKELSLSDKKFFKIKTNISEAIHFKQDGIDTVLFKCIEGIAAYYGKLLPQNVLEEIDLFLLDCLKNKSGIAYSQKIIKDKKQIETYLEPLRFLSHKFQLEKVAVLKEIMTGCKKAGKKENNEREPSKKRDPVKIRKNEYRKLESSGMELLVTSPGVKLGISKKSITILKDGKKEAENTLQNLKNISVISDGVSLSSNFIRLCSENNITIDFYHYNGKPYAKIFNPEFSDTGTGLSQLNAIHNGKGCYLAKAFISGKIRNQVNLLKYYFKYRKTTDENFSEAFEESIKRMNKNLHEIKELKENDPEILRGKLFSIEGRTAAIYWEMIEKMLDDYTTFEGRVRKGAKDLVNSMLNYGYGIIYSRIWEVAVKEKLNVNISFLHAPQENKPTLTYDMIEEFRAQSVDRAVFSLITKGEEMKVKDGLLDDNTRKRVAERIFERLNSFEKFRGKEMRLSEIMRLQAKAVVDFLEGRKNIYRPYVAKW